MVSPLLRISIHVPRVEDDDLDEKGERIYYISIHVPRVEDDYHFVSTLSSFFNFNPRPPCGGRQSLIFLSASAVCISIHVPRVEDDFTPTSSTTLSPHFNPRPPCGGRLSWWDADIGEVVDFNPRPPCGGRLTGDSDRKTDFVFQSTSPVWRTTV